MTTDYTCDYLVVGAGATGMAFVDTLLAHYSTADGKSSDTRVLLVDQHELPGGQWNDSYGFVRLHQPSSMYGVETEALEPDNNEEHRATRQEILDYYQRVVQKLETKYNFQFLGGVSFDLSQLTYDSKKEEDGTVYHLKKQETTSSIRVMKRVVDARFLQPDLPIFVKPRFTYDETKVNCVPVNAIADSKPYKYYVVIGGGKTGMDTVVYLVTKLQIPADQILWIIPHDAWITARENIGSCMELLHTSAKLASKQLEEDKQVSLQELMQSPQFLQNGFQEWERLGKIYRLHGDVISEIPPKFKDATLSKEEMEILRPVPVLRKMGRVKKITDNGDLVFTKSSDTSATTTFSLPWDSVDETMFVHCTAGAFNYTQQQQGHQLPPPPIFTPNAISIQDCYGTPGFCFVGSVIAMMECLDGVSDEERNQLLLAPKPQPDTDTAPNSLGPSGGDISGLSKDHGLVQRFLNLKHWLAIPKVKSWIFQNRLFNLKHFQGKPEEVDKMVQEIEQVLVQGGVM